MTKLLSFDGPLKLPHWTFYVRIAQIIFVFITFILTAFAVGVFGGGALPGYGLGIFTCIWTALFLVVAMLSDRIIPTTFAYTTILLFAAECTTTFWWLVSFAVMVDGASKISVLSVGIDTAQECEKWGDDPDCEYGYSYYSIVGPKATAASGATKAAAGISALVWIMFVSTLVASCLVLRSNSRGGQKSTRGQEMKSSPYEPVHAEV